jgi:hypothetical protein
MPDGRVSICLTNEMLTLLRGRFDWFPGKSLHLQKMIYGGIYGMIISPEEGGLMNGETYEPNTPDLHIHDKASRGDHGD